VSQAIGHFAIGVAGAFLLLIWNPRLLRKYVNIKNDIFFIGLSGVWAMMPDIKLVFGEANSQFLHSTIGNIFWLHPVFDFIIDVDDTTKMSAIFICVAVVLGYLYYLKTKGRLGIRLPGGN
jgi:hypothetical protein